MNSENIDATYNQSDFDEIRKNLFDIGQEYKLTDEELKVIYTESQEALKTINSSLSEIEKDRADAEEENRSTILSKINRMIEIQNNLSNLEIAEIKAAAIEILKYGNPVDYIIKVYNKHHVGDTQLGEVLLLSKASQSVSNSDGLQPKLSGQSGKGKTHAAKAMYHLLPDIGHKLQGSLSSKSLYYYPDLRPGTIVFSDDIRMSDDLEDTLKRAMSNFQEKTIHRTVDQQQPRELAIPERIVWWLTSVSSSGFSDELVNRLFDLGVDDSPEADEKVTEWALNRAKYGEAALPEDVSVTICRAIFYEIEKRLFNVDIPYSGRIIWKGSSDRRNLPRFLDLIRAFAMMKFMQRCKVEVDNNRIVAEIEDFHDAKALWDAGEASLITKLTRTELRLVQYMVSKGPLSVNEIVGGYMKPNGKPYTHEAIRKMLEGSKGRKGLTERVPGMLVHGSRGKGDERKYEIKSLDDNYGNEVVSMKPGIILERYYKKGTLRKGNSRY
jgi:hypothetical protein